MKSHVQRARERQASECSHGRALSLAVGALKSRIAQVRRDLAKERDGFSRRKLSKELDALLPVLELREREIAEALKAAEAERTI